MSSGDRHEHNEVRHGQAQAAEMTGVCRSLAADEGECCDPDSREHGRPIGVHFDLQEECCLCPTLIIRILLAV